MRDGGPTAQLTVRYPDAVVKELSLRGILVIGRECDGVPDSQRLLIDDPGVSRRHVELRIDSGSGEVFAVDTSTNGTYLNGARLDRAAIVPLRSGDRLRIGAIEVELQLSGPVGTSQRARTTVRTVSHGPMMHVVADIVDYSAVAQLNDSTTLAGAVDTVFGELHGMVRAQNGTVANFVGDAFYAVWDLCVGDRAPERALDFVTSAASVVGRMGPTLELKTSGPPLRMGWGVTAGDASMALLAGSLTTVLGDATNVAFRLSSVAGRGGHPGILVDTSARELAPEAFLFGDMMLYTLKGRGERVSALSFLGRHDVRSAAGGA